MLNTLKIKKNSKIQISFQRKILEIPFLKIENFNDVHLRYECKHLAQSY
jgi:hypothetical protein